LSYGKQTEERQREDVFRWLARHGLEIAPENVRVDLGAKRAEADTREEFQRLLRDAEDKRVNWIIVAELDRFGTKSKHQLISFVYRLQEAGCKLYDTNDMEWTDDDLITLMQAGIAGEKSEGELIDKGTRVIKGKLTKAATGAWLGGPTPYGCDVVCFEATSMREVWRLVVERRALGKRKGERRHEDSEVRRVRYNSDGTTKRYDGKGNVPAKEQGEVLQLRPTLDAAKLQTVRDMFRWYATESITLHQIAYRLNTKGILHPLAERWQNWHARELLRNPVYIGSPAWNKSASGKYFEFAEGRGQLVSKENRKHRKREASDWISQGNLFEPIVEPATFRAVQKKLSGSNGKTSVPRAPRNPQMWLAGLLVCGGCGRRMRGQQRANGGHYVCATYYDALAAPKGSRGKSPCKINSISHAKVEAYLSDYLRDGGVTLAAIADAFTANEDEPTVIGDAIGKAMSAFHRCRDVVLWRVPKGFVYDSIEPVIAEYRKLHAADAPGLVKQLAKLNSEHDKVTGGLLNLPATARLAIEKTQARLADLERQIDDVKARLANDADEHEKWYAEYEWLCREWAAAQKSLVTEATERAKAESVGRVVSSIVLTFRDSGRKRPSSVLDSVDFVSASDAGAGGKGGGGAAKGSGSFLRESSGRSRGEAGSGSGSRSR
jgi:DNA invertase Pin-like site-specific DNA recombinase